MHLIFYPKNELKPVGGSAGYLFNLSKGLSDSEFDFLPDSRINIPYYSKYKKFIPKVVLDYRRALYMLKEINNENPKPDTIEEYDCIHFNSTLSMYVNRKWLDSYKGKVILTSHSPCALHREMIDQLDKRVYRLLKSKLDSMSKFDEYAFRRADAVIFPTEYSEEPYFNTWDNYKNIRDAKKNKYMASGLAARCAAKESRNVIRKKYGIPQDAFLISYVGRHNEIKGFDVLKSIGQDLIKENIWVIVAGKNEPIKGLENPHWIEVGWTNDPHSIMAASDLFILPNKETYFDLVLLEAISLGIPCLISNTGGNKFFKNYEKTGIMLFESIGEAEEKIKQFREIDFDSKCELKEKLITLFNDEFSLIPFVNRYKKTIDEILE